jgi:hypothetical protein
MNKDEKIELAAKIAATLTPIAIGAERQPVRTMDVKDRLADTWLSMANKILPLIDKLEAPDR